MVPSKIPYDNIYFQSCLFARSQHTAVHYVLMEMISFIAVATNKYKISGTQY